MLRRRALLSNAFKDFVYIGDRKLYRAAVRASIATSLRNEREANECESDA
jgi:hypothetical protein